MALFTDGLMNDAESLREYESSVLSVAATADVSLEAKLRVAQREIGLEVQSFLERNGNTRQSLEGVVVTDGLKHWHAVHALECIYRDAYHSQINDRFREKYERYAALARSAKAACFDLGIGISLAPIPAGPKPEVSTVKGGAMPSRTVLVSIAWLRRGDSGAAGEPAAVELRADQRLSVRAAGAPEGVEAFAVYAGLDADNMFRQGTAAAGDAWLEAGPLDASGERPGRGQRADFTVRFSNLLRRG